MTIAGNSEEENTIERFSHRCKCIDKIVVVPCCEDKCL